MVTLGKLNCDEFAMGSSTRTAPRNLWGRGGAGRSLAACRAVAAPAPDATALEVHPGAGGLPALPAPATYGRPPGWE
jgi:hypothetical protein